MREAARVFACIYVGVSGEALKPCDTDSIYDKLLSQPELHCIALIDEQVAHKMHDQGVSADSARSA